jgi:membrane protein YqaA with SNARE-associated domain
MIWSILFGAFLGYLLGCLIVEVIGNWVSHNLYTPEYKRMMPIFWATVVFSTILGGMIGWLLQLQ